MQIDISHCTSGFRLECSRQRDIRHHDRTSPQSNDRMAWPVRHVAHRLCTGREPKPGISRSEYAARNNLLDRRAACRRTSLACARPRRMRVLRSARTSRAGPFPRLAAIAGGRKLQYRATSSFARVHLSRPVPGRTPAGFAVPRLKRPFPAIHTDSDALRRMPVTGGLQLGYFAPCVRDAADRSRARTRHERRITCESNRRKSSTLRSPRSPA